MPQKDLLSYLYRTQYGNIVSLLCRRFGFENVNIAEDITADTFLLAYETWENQGYPGNPAAWLYTVAKNKAKYHLKRHVLLNSKIITGYLQNHPDVHEAETELTEQNIADSQLQMMFAICNPVISAGAQVGLALRILCGFGIDEIASAFLSNKETINKRLFRAKEKLRQENIALTMPGPAGIDNRLDNVIITLYLLFNEGYYSLSQNTVLKKELCLEALRLAYMLTENVQTNQPSVNALIAMMCFHASRFAARLNADSEPVMYEDQDAGLWDDELILKGEIYFAKAAAGSRLSKYHLEAAIARLHTRKTDTGEKWETILQLYNKLLLIAYSPVAALNRTYALARASGKQAAIPEAKKLGLDNNHLYHSLLGYLYTDIDNGTALQHLNKALHLARSKNDKKVIAKRINELTEKNHSLLT